MSYIIQIEKKFQNSPQLYQYHNHSFHTLLVWKLLTKDFTIILNNDYIWDFVTEKDPNRFRLFIIDAYGVLLKREEYRKADLLKSILDSS